MSSHEILPLKCPSCGSATTGPSRTLPFGSEFSCSHCACTSILIINRALLPADVLQNAENQVCAQCGRVAKLDARFCQAGHKLVRTCLNHGCSKEFPAYHQRCDYCGWPQDVKPGTPEAYERELDLAIAVLSSAVMSKADLSGFSKNEVHLALNKVQTIWKASRRGKRAVASIVSLLNVRGLLKLQGAEAVLAWHTLAGMGADAVEAVPMLLRQIDDDAGCGWGLGEQWSRSNFCRVLAMISPLEALPYCRKDIELSGKNPKEDADFRRLNSALEIAEFAGKVAVPMLLEFCGAFSGQRGANCQKTVNAISEKGRRASLNDSSWVRD